MSKDNAVVVDVIKDAEAKLKSLMEYEEWLKGYCAEHPELNDVCEEAFKMIKEKKRRWQRMIQK